jgi:hypothetical protein
MLCHLQFVTAPQLDSWLQQHSQNMLSQFNTQPAQQTVRAAAVSVLNAFATGQNVTFHAGLVDWYLAPDNVLAQLGYSQEQIREFLGLRNASPAPVRASLRAPPATRLW